MATTISPYFELSWAVLSTIGLNNVLIGFMVAGITGGFSVVLLVPIITSAGCALANGLCYVAWIAEYSVVSKAVAAVFATFGWLIQEAGLPFYGYMILGPILHDVERRIYLTIFWALTLTTVVCRGVAITIEMLFTFEKNISHDLYQTVNRRLIISSFVAIALAECTTAVFLLREFRSTLRSMTGPLNSRKLLRYLICSTEIRIATLAFIGILRAATYSSHAIGSGSADGVTNQLDRFAITLQAQYPVVMLQHRYPRLAPRVRLREQGKKQQHQWRLGGAVAVHLNDIDMLAVRHVELSLPASHGVEPPSSGANS